MPAPACEVCGKLNARYVCQACGKQVCRYCFNVDEETCVDCVASLGPSAQRSPSMPEETRLGWGYRLFLIGFFTTFIGVLLMLLSSLLHLPDLVSGGFIVFLGPIPIPIGLVFGPYGNILTLASAIVMTILITLFIVLQRRKVRRSAAS